MAKSVTVFTKVVLFAAEPTLRENPREPVHPPIETNAFTPYIFFINVKFSS